MQSSAKRGPADTNRSDPTEHFVIDFLTPYPSVKCTKCASPGAVPLTRHCPACDPLLAHMATAASEKAAAEQRRKESSIVGGVADLANSFFRGGDNNRDLSDHGFGCYDH